MSTDQCEIISVKEINRRANALLRGEQRVSLQVEVLSFSVPPSGHWFFLFKDRVEDTKISGVMHIPHRRDLEFIPSQGDVLEIHGRIEVYEPTGRYQINIDTLLKIDPPESNPIPLSPPPPVPSHVPENPFKKTILVIAGVVVVFLIIAAIASP